VHGGFPHAAPRFLKLRIVRRGERRVRGLYTKGASEEEQCECWTSSGFIT
jgi:hypothetical protein